MKIRIKGNTLRLRLLQSEVSQIKEGKGVEEKTYFSFKQKLTYKLAVSKTLDKITADFQRNKITVWIPQTIALQWADSEIVSLEGEQENGTEENLRILIEKDFRCLQTHHNEDQSDNYPNPKDI